MEFIDVWKEFVKDQESEEHKNEWLENGLEEEYKIYIDELHTCRHDMENFYEFLVKGGMIKNDIPILFAFIQKSLKFIDSPDEAMKFVNDLKKKIEDGKIN